MAAELVNAVVSGIASKVAEILFDPIQRQIFYVFKYQRYVEKLRNQLVDVKKKIPRLEQTVKNAERQGDEVYADVKACLSKMNEFIARAENLINEEEEKAKNERCFKGLCSNLMSRRKLSKEAVNAAKDADDLLREIGEFKLDTTVSYRPAPERIEITDVVRGYQQFDSRVKVFQNVIEALMDSNVNMIGLYGMGGVGKTTLAKQVEKKVVEDKFFDEVVMAEVTQVPDLKIIQDKLAYDLGITFVPHESAFERVGRLRRRLKEKRVLVILDNIWGKIQLEDFGIPFGDNEKERKDVQRRCTVLLTSRSHHVLSNDMKSQMNFSIEVLSDEEAMILFWKSIDDKSIKTSSFQRLAEEIVRKCGGLPVAITTIASALKNKTIEVWKDALNDLRNSDARHIHGMEANVYFAIKLSYNILVNEEAKSLFRLCALQNDASRISITDLMMYVMGSGWFRNVSRLEQARNKVHTLIDNLKSSCLLLDGDNEHVKMHDIIYAVAVSIAEEEHMFNLQNTGQLEQQLENVIPKDPIAISLTYRDIQELPQRLEYPKLNLFLFFTNYGSSLQIQNLFFEGMKQLRVLNLTRIVFPLSPPSLMSLACLINLRTLSLINCRSVVDVALVGELKKLEILSFQGSDIEQLPVEIGQLAQLKKLDVSNCYRLEVISPNVISKLSQLEELYMLNSFTQWEKGEGGSNASLVELNALSQLTTLEIDIPNAKIMSQDLVSVELERFKIYVGDVWDWITDYCKFEVSRMLKLSGLVKNIYLGEGMKMLLKRSEELHLDQLNDFQNIADELDDGEGFPQLKCLYLQNSPKILYVFSTVGQAYCNVFPLLESLLLHNLIHLEKICCNQLMEDQSFSKLRIIKVEECHELKHLLSFSMAKNLVQLQKIKVINCKGLKLIVGEERENYIVHENEGISFTLLRSLTLTGLPQLTCSGFNVELSQRLSAMPSLASKEIVVEDDLKDFITALFNNKVTFPALEKLELASLNIKKIWLDQFSAGQKLTKLEVKNCCRLKYLFSYSMVHSLVQLQNLVIDACESMECVINTNELRSEEEQMIKVMIFPRLNSLTLSNLPRLTRFVSMCLLEENSILHNDIKAQSLFHEKAALLLPSLEVLNIQRVNELSNIWHHQLDSNSFCKLKQVKVTQCSKLMNVFHSNNIREWKFERLESLWIEGCGSIKEVIIEEETSFNRTMNQEFLIASSSNMFQVFSQLTSLYLRDLPSLKSIYRGICVLEWPLLKNLTVERCSKEGEILFGSSELFSREIENQQLVFLIDHHKVGLPSLETLTITGMSKLRKIWHHQLDLDCFSKLKQLNVFYCHKLMHIFPSNIIVERKFERLESLSVGYCDSIKEIIEEERSFDRIADEEFPITSPSTSSRFQVFPQLTTMTLNSLLDLKSVYQGIHMLEWPVLEYLTVYNCQKVEMLFGSSELLNREMDNQQPVFLIDHHKVTFSNLKTLVVSNCHGLRNFTTLSTVKSLAKLAKISINDCDLIEEIIQEVGEVKEDPIVFSELVHLELHNLPRLQHFFVGNYTLKFPSLKQVIVSACLNMKIFSQGVLHTPNLQKLQLRRYVEENEGWWEGNLNSTIQKVFDEMAGLHSLDQLILSQIPRVKEIWHSQTLPANFFDNLSSLVVDNCKLMSSAIPANLPQLLKNLYRLEVRNCDSVEEVFHTEEPDADDHFVKLLPKLIWLCLINLPKLKRVCNFSGDRVELPFLESLWIENCSNMETFISNSTHAQSFFSEKVGFSNLKKLTIMGMCKLRKIWHHQLDLNSFSKLEQLEVIQCDRLVNIFSSNIIFGRRFERLKNLSIEYCGSIKEIIEEETSSNHLVDEEFPMGSTGNSFQVFSQLTKLRLICLPSLKSIYQRIYLLEWPALEDLTVQGCDKVEILFGSSELLNRETENQPVFLIDHHKGLPSLETITIREMSKLRKIWHHQLNLDSFHKLKQLKVFLCHELRNIFSSNIILERRFNRLESLSIEYCGSIKEIIAEEISSNCIVDQDVHKAGTGTSSRFQVFSQLTFLKLQHLPEFRSIYQGIHMLEWPALTDLMVDKCEKVEILFGSSKLFQETDSQQLVFLIDYDKVAFPSLRTLNVLDCDRLRNLTILSTVESMVKLARIEISYCKMIEEIIQEVGEVKEDPIIFSQLECLELDNLPRLQHFFWGNYTLEFSQLKQVVVSGCLNMKIFSQGMLCTPNLHGVQLTKYKKENEERWEGTLNSTIQKTFEEMAGLCGLDELILSEVPHVKEIWHSQTLPVNCFNDLCSLLVDDCPFMSSAIPSNLPRFLKSLEFLEVRNCDSIEEVCYMEELNADEQFVQLFPELEWLKLIDLPKLKRFYNFSGNIIELPSLWSLSIENCPNLEIFISNSAHAQPLFNKKIAFHCLRQLKLSKLPKLLHLCKENSSPFDIFPNLKTLEISECSKLEQFLPSWVSFHNLTSMEVSKCDGLINLLTLSTAKSLVKLERMKVTDCKMIEEIMHVREEVKNGCLIFSQLKYLELSCLPSLTSFCLGNYALEIPSLKQVIVKECQKMEIFSRGVLSTPKLQRLQLTELEDEGCWEGSLNSTIQKLFEEMNVQSSKDEDGVNQTHP